MDETKVLQRYREYLQKRVENQVLQQQKEEEYKRAVEQRRQANSEKYSLKPVTVSADRECCECHRTIPKGTQALHRTGIETNPRTHNPRWASYYWCNQCKPLNTKEENM
ncbi:MAG: hypothetical protein QM398_10400 [Thermoproteota archaeon]|nr:hypothetical protein [Thermoproteota archaeon]